MRALCCGQAERIAAERELQLVGLYAANRHSDDAAPSAVVKQLAAKIVSRYNSACIVMVRLQLVRLGFVHSMSDVTWPVAWLRARWMPSKLPHPLLRLYVYVAFSRATICVIRYPCSKTAVAVRFGSAKAISG